MPMLRMREMSLIMDPLLLVKSPYPLSRPAVGPLRRGRPEGKEVGPYTAPIVSLSTKKPKAKPSLPHLALADGQPCADRSTFTPARGVWYERCRVRGWPVPRRARRTRPVSSPHKGGS